LITNAGSGLFKAFIFLKNYQIWPESGGLLVQTSKFLKCVELCDNVLSKHEEIESAEADIKARMNQNLAKMQKGAR
jgi:hypothetical protein